jgi:hypothetical protein
MFYSTDSNNFIKKLIYVFLGFHEQLFYCHFYPICKYSLVESNKNIIHHDDDIYFKMLQCFQCISNINFTFPILMYIVLSKRPMINNSNYMILIFQKKIYMNFSFSNMSYYLLNKLPYKQHQSSLHLASYLDENLL